MLTELAVTVFGLLFVRFIEHTKKRPAAEARSTDPVLANLQHDIDKHIHLHGALNKYVNGGLGVLVVVITASVTSETLNIGVWYIRAFGIGSILSIAAGLACQWPTRNGLRQRTLEQIMSDAGATPREFAAARVARLEAVTTRKLSRFTLTACLLAGTLSTLPLGLITR